MVKEIARAIIRVAIKKARGKIKPLAVASGRVGRKKGFQYCGIRYDSSNRRFRPGER